MQHSHAHHTEALGSGAGVCCLTSSAKSATGRARWWSNGQRLQRGETCLISASKGGHIEVVKYLCEVGGKELVMMTDMVSAECLFAHVCTNVDVQVCIHAYIRAWVATHQWTELLNVESSWLQKACMHTNTRVHIREPCAYCQTQH
jgi:hypothetical protein